MIKVTNPDYWIATEEFVPKFHHLYGSAASVTKLMLLGGDQSSGAASMDQMLRLGASQSDIRIPSMDYKEQIAMILFSSGTTGFPKGVALSHYNLVATRRQGM
jgi:4-coumarate--CoA ligase